MPAVTDNRESIIASLKDFEKLQTLDTVCIIEAKV